MKTTLTIISLLAVLAGCDSATKKKEPAGDQEARPDSVLALKDTTPRVTGIGGIFFFSDDPGKAKEWYHQNLGLETNEYGATFETRNASRPDEINYSEWSPFKKGSSYFAPSKKEFMINYRVQNLEGLLRKLRANGVTIVDSVQAVDYGKFVHIMDAEGNKIELWEPIDHVLTKMGGKTNK
jgi:predicted enzyme related to lactoylglutathione lyase